MTTGGGEPLAGQHLGEFIDGFREWVASSQARLAGLLAPSADFEVRVARGRRLRALLCEEGWGLSGWPVGAGGRGGTILHRAVIYEELYRAGWSGPAIFEHLEIVAPTLIRYGDPGFVREVLPSFLDGTQAWAQGFSESESGSDLASLRTHATTDGPDYLVTGAKIWTSWARYADWCLALVRTGTAAERHRGLTMVAIDLRGPGVAARAIRQANGTDELGEVTFDGVRVPLRQVVGGVGRGWQVAMYLLAHERGTLSWLRHCAFLQRLTASSDAQREDTDRQAGDVVLQTVGVRAAAANLLTREAAGQELGPDSAFNKLLMTRAEQSLFNFLRDVDGAQIALPDDSEEEAVLQQDYLFSRIVTIYGGSQQMQLITVARHILGLGGA